MNSIRFCGGFLVLLVLSVGLSRGDVYDDFETNHTGGGDVNGISGTLWTITGNNAWGRSTNGFPGMQGTAWAWSNFTGDSSMGTMTSNPFTLDGNLLQVKFGGWGGNGQSHGQGYNPAPIGDMNSGWELFRAADDKLLSQGTGPFMDGLVDYTIDVSPFQGQEAYLKLTDGDTRGGSWLGVDYVRTGSRDATSVFSLEVGRDQSDWTVNAPFSFNTVLGLGKPASEGGEFLRSFDAGTGTAQSPNFTITRDTLEFDTAGFGNVDHAGIASRIELHRASDGGLLYTWGDDEALGGNDFLAQSTDVSAWMGQAAYLLLLDNVDGGYGWVGIDDVRLTGAFIPEPGTLALLATGLIGLLCYAWRKRK